MIGFVMYIDVGNIFFKIGLDLYCRYYLIEIRNVFVGC